MNDVIAACFTPTSATLQCEFGLLYQENWFFEQSSFNYRTIMLTVLWSGRISMDKYYYIDNIYIKDIGHVVNDAEMLS